MTTAAQRIAGGRVGVGRFDTVVLDCPDPRALAEFYAGLLGQDIADDGDDSWQSLSGDGTGVSLAFQRAANYVAPRWPDGPPQHPDQTSGFRVYADPAGHPFCLCR
jgi:hypothetical protein